MIPAHSNVFVRNLPVGMDLSGLRDLFRPYGAIESVRILEPQQCGQQRLGFVKYCNVEDAKLAIDRMSGARIEQYCLEVKLADSDVAPKHKQVPGYDVKGMSSSPTGMVSENDHLFVRGFPHYWGEEELADFFADAGIVVEARVHGCHNPSKGASGFVRLSCVEEARHAIESFDGSIVDGYGPIRVQFADKKDDKEKYGGGLKTLAHTPMRATPSPTPATPPGMFGLLGGQYSDADFSEFASREFSFQDELRREALMEGGLTTSAIERCVQKKLEALLQRFDVLQLDPKRGTSSVYVAKLPPDTDRLFLYEKFAPYGAISSVRVLYDENRKCTGVGFVNFLDPVCAKQAVMAMNGTRVAGRPLQVRLQDTRGGKIEQR